MHREHQSPLLELEAANRRALFGQFDRSQSLIEKANQAPYFGYVEVRIGDVPPFLMFNNGDDVVAQNYLYDQQPGFEPASVRLWAALATEARYVFDVGAFSGIFSLIARSANPRALVWSFEPARNSFSRLVTNIWANRFNAQVAPVMLALGDKACRSQVRHPFGVYVLGSGESLLDTVVKDAWYTEEIDVLPGDALEAARRDNPRRFVVESAIEGVDLMKLDVEGFEPNVLDGMPRMLAEHRPTMLIECRDEASLAAIELRMPKTARVYYVDDAKVCLHSDRERFVTDDERNERNIFVVLRPEIDVEAVCAAAGVFSEIHPARGARR